MECPSVSPFQCWARSDTPSSTCKFITPLASKPKANMETGIQGVGNTDSMHNSCFMACSRTVFLFVHLFYPSSICHNFGRGVDRTDTRSLLAALSASLTQPVEWVRGIEKEGTKVNTSSALSRTSRAWPAARSAATRTLCCCRKWASMGNAGS